MRNEECCDVFILWKIVEVLNYHSTWSADERIMALKICVAVMVFRWLFLRWSLIFFVVLRCSEPPHVPLNVQYASKIYVLYRLKCTINVQEILRQQLQLVGRKYILVIGRVVKQQSPIRKLSLQSCDSGIPKSQVQLWYGYPLPIHLVVTISWIKGSHIDQR